MSGGRDWLFPIGDKSAKPARKALAVTSTWLFMLERERFHFASCPDHLYVLEIESPLPFVSAESVCPGYLRAIAVDTFTSETEAKKNSVAAIKGADGQLGNSSAVCRKRYFHPCSGA